MRVGGSFSAVTLALLETPKEEIPHVFQPWEILLGSGLGPPAELMGAHQQQLLQEVLLDPPSQGLSLPAKAQWRYPAPSTGVSSLHLEPQSDLDRD